MQSAEIPTLPVLVPATVVALGLSLWWLHRRGRLTVLRAAVAVAVCVYAAGVLGHVLLPFPIDASDPRPWRVWIHLTPFVDVAEDPIGMVLNIALFVPLGFLLPLVVRVGSARRAVLYGVLASLGIEMVQLVGDLTVSPGRVADVDDLIGNAIGTLIGYAVFSLAVAVPAVAKLAARAAWMPAASEPVSATMER
ncbi:VanZ family protein [Nocardioides sp. CN2-186]|uniref:VanZ family protein n=1 Tax=Nocardioides tweenelious TaxID=3156607 RepID=UPI0032B57667